MSGIPTDKNTAELLGVPPQLMNLDQGNASRAAEPEKFEGAVESCIRYIVRDELKKVLKGLV